MMTVRVFTNLIIGVSQFRHPLHYCSNLNWGLPWGFLGTSQHPVSLYPLDVSLSYSICFIALLLHLCSSLIITFPYILLPNLLPRSGSLPTRVFPAGWQLGHQWVGIPRDWLCPNTQVLEVGLFVGEESLTSWSNESWWILCLRKPLWLQGCGQVQSRA